MVKPARRLAVELFQGDVHRLRQVLVFVLGLRQNLEKLRALFGQQAEGRDLRDHLQADELGFVRALLAEADYLARVEATVLGAPDLDTCIRWLREGIPAGARPLPAGELERHELPAPFTTYLVECARCGEERPFVWRVDAYLCEGCGRKLS